MRLPILSHTGNSIDKRIIGKLIPEKPCLIKQTALSPHREQPLLPLCVRNPLRFPLVQPLLPLCAWDSRCFPLEILPAQSLRKLLL